MPTPQFSLDRGYVRRINRGASAIPNASASLRPLAYAGRSNSERCN